MNTTRLMILGSMLGTITLGSFASAQDKEKHGGDHADRPVPPEILEKYDKDKDGKLSKEERETMRADREKEYDKDGDGKLSDEERKAMREDLHKKMLAKYDKDGDGKLSDEEKKAMPHPPKEDGKGPDAKPEKPGQ